MFFQIPSPSTRVWLGNSIHIRIRAFLRDPRRICTRPERRSRPRRWPTDPCWPSADARSSFSGSGKSAALRISRTFDASAEESCPRSPRKRAKVRKWEAHRMFNLLASFHWKGSFFLIDWAQNWLIPVIFSSFSTSKICHLQQEYPFESPILYFLHFFYKWHPKLITDLSNELNNHLCLGILDLE